MEKRNNTIKKEYQQGSLKQIAKKFNLSPERIRQIVSEYRTANIPRNVLEKEYKKNIVDILLHELIQESVRLSYKKRDTEYVVQRQIFIHTLKKIFGLPFTEIGFLLQRDHSSIMNLYNQEEYGRRQKNSQT